MAPLSLTIASLFVIYAMLIQPVLRRGRYQKFSREASARPDLRAKYYLSIMSTKWLWLIAVGAVLLLGSIPPSVFGLRAPDDWSYTLLYTAEIVIILPIALVIMVRRMVKTQRPGLAALLLDVKDMLPRTSYEQRLWLLLSVSAGVCEEIVFRGFLLWYLPALGAFLGLQISLLTALVLSSALFGFAHLYQGWKGVLGTGLAGAVLAYLYLLTGSLFLPILFHILIDARIVFIAPALLKLDQREKAQ